MDERIGLTKRATSTRCSASAREEPREDPRASFAFKSAAVATAAALALTMGSPAAIAGVPKGQGVKSTDELGRTDVDRCSLEALGKGASTRAAFSDFATEQNKELYVNVEGCDYSNMDLSNEVLSGIKARGANFSNSIFPKEASRADFSDANLAGAVIRSANLFNSIFAGTNMENADYFRVPRVGCVFREGSADWHPGEHERGELGGNSVRRVGRQDDLPEPHAGVRGAG